MTPSVARETVEIAEVNPRPSPELIADELMSYPEVKRQKLLDSIDCLPSDEAMTKKLKILNFEEQRQVITDQETLSQFLCYQSQRFSFFQCVILQFPEFVHLFGI